MFFSFKYKRHADVVCLMWWIQIRFALTICAGLKPNTGIVGSFQTHTDELWHIERERTIKHRGLRMR